MNERFIEQKETLDTMVERIAATATTPSPAPASAPSASHELEEIRHQMNERFIEQKETLDAMVEKIAATATTPAPAPSASHELEEIRHQMNERFIEQKETLDAMVEKMAAPPPAPAPAPSPAPVPGASHELEEIRHQMNERFIEQKETLDTMVEKMAATATTPSPAPSASHELEEIRHQMNERFIEQKETLDAMVEKMAATATTPAPVPSASHELEEIRHQMNERFIEQKETLDTMVERIAATATTPSIAPSASHELEEIRHQMNERFIEQKETLDAMVEKMAAPPPAPAPAPAPAPSASHELEEIRHQMNERFIEQKETLDAMVERIAATATTPSPAPASAPSASHELEEIRHQMNERFIEQKETLDTMVERIAAVAQAPVLTKQSEIPTVKLVDFRQEMHGLISESTMKVTQQGSEAVSSAVPGSIYNQSFDNDWKKTVTPITTSNAIAYLASENERLKELLQAQQMENVSLRVMAMSSPPESPHRMMNMYSDREDFFSFASVDAEDSTGDTIYTDLTAYTNDTIPDEAHTPQLVRPSRNSPVKEGMSCAYANKADSTHAGTSAGADVEPADSRVSLEIVVPEETERKLSSMAQKYTVLANSLLALQSEYDALAADYDTISIENDALREGETRLQSELETLRSMSAPTDVQNDPSEASVLVPHTPCRDTKSQSFASDSSLSSHTVTECVSDIDSPVFSLEQYKDSPAVKSIKKKFDHLQSKVNDSEEINAALSLENQSLHTKLMELKTTSAGLKAINSSLLNELECTQNQANGLQDALEDRTKALEESNANLEFISADYDTTKQLLLDAKTDIVKLKDALNQVHA
jgi:hypothetical protein